MESHKEFIQVILISLVASLCFFTLLYFSYTYDNKYTTNSPQPINGILSLTEDDLVQDVLFPSHGWQFFDGQLLKPQDVASGLSDYTMQFITIGKYNDFSFGNKNKSPYGKASYRLILNLPDTPHIYTLSIPEIYTSYQLYINSELLLSMGNFDTHSSAIGKRTITFQASGRTALLFSVQNYDHFYSGITFPPAFGLAENIMKFQNTKLFLHSILLVMILILFSFSLYFGIRLKSQSAITLALLSFFLLIQSAYPVFYSFFTVEHRFAFSLELLATYAVYLFTIKLQNIFFNGTTIGYRYFSFFFYLFAILAFLYGMIAIPSSILHLYFSILIAFTKFAAAIYLIVNTLYGAFYHEPYAYLAAILTGIIPIALFADRLFPFYEPIYGGYFTEYSGIIVVLVGAGYLWFSLTDAYRFQLTFAEERRILIRQVAIQKSHYAELTEKIAETRQQRHDLRHHLKAIYKFLADQDVDKALDYLNSCDVHAGGYEPFILCENTIGDALLQYYKKLCNENGISFRVSVSMPNDIPMEDTDISILLGNLLENAYDACLLLKDSSPYIEVKGGLSDTGFAFYIENSCGTNIIQKGNRFYSTKHSGFGIGTESVKTVAKKYNGILGFDASDDCFKVSILLQF